MATLMDTLEKLKGNALKVWLSNKKNQQKLNKANLDEKLYIMEKWAQAYDGAPFPFELQIDSQPPGNAPPGKASKVSAPSSDADNDPPDPETQPKDRSSDAGNGNGTATSPGPEDQSLFGKGNIPKKPPAVLMTEQQRFLANMVAAAAKEAPRVESIRHLKTALQMLVPKAIKDAHREYTYKWTSNENLQSDLHTYGGMWEIVTRTNHPDIDDRFFDITGAVTWKGASVLTFTRRAITEEMDKETIREFNLKADQAIKNLDRSYGTAKGKEAVRLTISDQAPQDRSFGEEDITIHDPNLADAPNNPEEYYDYGDTGAPEM